MADHPESRPSSSVRAELTFTLYAIVFVCAAVYHALGAALPDWDPGSSRMRHGVFVGINLALAVLMRTRPKWFFPAFSLLCVQQLVSHGGDVVHELRQHQQLDVMSVLVLAALGFAWFALWRDFRAKGRAQPSVRKRSK